MSEIGTVREGLGDEIKLPSVPISSPKDGTLQVSNSMLLSWRRCRQQWYWSYVDKWEPKKPASYFEVGTLVHKFLQDYYNGELDLQEAMKDARFQSEEDIQTFQLGVMLSKKYTEDFAPYEDTWFDVMETEYHFQVPFKTPNKEYKFVLEGYVDLIVRDKKTRQVWIWDHKTGGRFWTTQQVDMDSQLPTYAWAIQTLLGEEVFGFIINQLNTYNYKNYMDTPPEKLFKREKSYRTQTELQHFVYQLGLSVEDIIENRGFIYKNMNKDCSYCQFEKICHMDAKGIPVDVLFAEDYQKRADFR